MPYTDHFTHADDVVKHLNGVVPILPDPLLRMKYVGFVTVAAITVYELAIKEIFIEFARKKHKVLGQFTESYFDRINGRIKIKIIQEDYISKFGRKYVDRFQTKLLEESNRLLAAHKRDLRSSYANLILWRNDFAHEGRLAANATYSEVVTAYEDGKLVIKCLAEAMVR
jgi:hypothetical protein